MDQIIKNNEEENYEQEQEEEKQEIGRCGWCGEGKNRKLIHFQGDHLDIWCGSCCINLVRDCDYAIENDNS